MGKEHFEILLESIDNKFQLVLEGHSSLANQIRDARQELLERADLTDFKIEVINSKLNAVAADLKATDERLSKKIDAVATDLKAHRVDTEAHHGLYAVRE